MPHSSKVAPRVRTIKTSSLRSTHRPILSYLLFIVLAVHLMFLASQAVTSGKNFLICWPLHVSQRRLLMLPNLYRDVLRVNALIPSNATLWYVAPYKPHYILYYIYPRKIKWGSPHLSDAMHIHQEHPRDWILSDETYDNPMDRLHLIAPDVQ